MALPDRIKIYKDIEKKRGNPLIVYVTSQRKGAAGSMAADAVEEFIDQIELIDGVKNRNVDLYIESTGGDPLTSWRIISLLRTKFEKITVFVSHSAFSAATLLALGADEIIMGPFASLGPIDPQITTKKADGSTQQFGYEDVISFLNFVKEEAGLTEQQYIQIALDKLCSVVEPTVLGFAKRSSSLSVSMGEKMLQMHMIDSEKKLQAGTIATKLNKSYFNHGHALSRKDAKAIGLNVQDMDSELEKLIWEVHRDFEKELQTRVPFDPLAEFLKDEKAAPFLRPVPPINIPPQLNPQLAVQMLQEYINGQLNVELPDVQTELKYAFIESISKASEYYVKSKVIFQRTLDMKFNGNLITLSQGWRNVKVKNNGKK